VTTRGLAASALALAVLGAAACGGAGDGGGRDPDGAAPAPSPDGTPRTTNPAATATVTAEQSAVTIAFAGDVHFEGALAARLDDPSTALEPIAPQLSAADLTIVNLESAVGVGGRAEPKRFTFQAPPSALDALAAAGVDVVTMANNHAGDFGRDGVRQALAAAAGAAAADPPLQVVGIGETADEAFAPAEFELGGTTVAVLGASAADQDPTADATGHLAATADQPGTADAVDPTQLVAAVGRARSRADIVIVYLHWGVQGESCPSGEQAALAEAVVDAGAHIVVGSHTHRLQGAGMHGDTFVAYGLGNFAWYTQASDATTATGLLTVVVDEGTVVESGWDPARIGADGLPAFVTGAEADRMTQDFAALAACAAVEPLIP
jgi:poly-gamma-glutamate capsule biosynthesis protein CapA/YwtB (metallophosphatase superfamily)